MGPEQSAAIYSTAVTSRFDLRRETRRQFLTGSVAGAALGLRMASGQDTRNNAEAGGIQAGEPTGSIALLDVTVIDVRAGIIVPRATVTIAADRIQSVATKVVTPARAGTRIIEGNGKFLIPALWDMHSHPNDPWMLPPFIANGVTGTRAMWGLPIQHRWRSEITAAARVGPSLVIASPILDGPGADPNPDPPWRIVSNGEQGRQAVRRAVQEGADFIKVYERLSRESYFAIADESAKLGVPFAGHVPRQVTPQECSAAGQKSIEHVFLGVQRACHPDYEAWRQAVIHAANPARVPMPDPEALFKAFDISRVAAMASVFRRNRTFFCPTQITGLGVAGDPILTGSPYLQIVGPKQKAAWAKVVNSPGLSTRRRMQVINAQITRTMYESGVEILAGTDTPNPYCLPGFGLHDELESLVRAGLTPLDALRTATVKPAQFLGRLDSIGTVEPGKLAELVLLDASPLENIANTRTVNVVISGGRIFRKAALEALSRPAGWP